MPAVVPPVAVGLGEFLVDLGLGTVLFVVVITVTVILMYILQAVLPHGDTEADALAAAQHSDETDEETETA